MLGRRFCPRIRSVQHQRLYRIDRDRDYGILTDLVARADHTIDIEVIQGQWERMGQFYSMARPRLDEQERRARTVGVRVTAAEATELRERAQAARLSMGAYLRRRALGQRVRI